MWSGHDGFRTSNPHALPTPASRRRGFPAVAASSAFHAHGRSADSRGGHRLSLSLSGQPKPRRKGQPMPDATTAFPAGDYHYMPGVFQYSCGVAALPGWRIERVRFAAPVPLVEGFRRIASHLQAAGRPLTAFCACELQSPAPFTEDGFEAFNRVYVGTLERWGIYQDGVNPVARANTCPVVAPPPEPSFHAFCFTTPAAADAPRSFVVAGSGEAPEGRGNYRDHIVARGDTSPPGLRRKAIWVLGEMERRMAALGGGWHDTTAVQVYTEFDIHPFIADELARRGVMRHGLTWHLNRPPVMEIDYEMDCRAVFAEHVIAVR